MGATATTELLRELETCIELTRRVREEVQAGRLDAMEEAVAERGRRMDRIRRQLTTDVREDPAVEAALDRLKTDNEALLEWMAAEKSVTLGAMSSVREEGGDPYRERLVGSTILDRTV